MALAHELAHLADLHTNGALSDDEFSQAKSLVLNVLQRGGPSETVPAVATIPANLGGPSPNARGAGWPPWPP